MATNLLERSKYVVFKIGGSSGATRLWSSELGPTGQFVEMSATSENLSFCKLWIRAVAGRNGGTR